MTARTLVIMAAGLGSRYGGVKQIEPVGPHGERIIDYSSYDAIASGFDRIVFVIKREIEREFREVIGRGVERAVSVEYAFQSIDDVPAGRRVPTGRTKPWGTVHAVMAASRFIDAPFAVINADDFYGARAFKEMYDWIADDAGRADGIMHHAMVAYRASRTLSDTGGVTRGVCTVDDRGMLVGVKERRGLERAPGGARYRRGDGMYEVIPGDTRVSMNFWGLDAAFIAEVEAGFDRFLERGLSSDPMGCEYLLPDEIDHQISSGRADVRVLESDDEWHGVTYREDRHRIVNELAEMHRSGVFPTPLWG